MIWFCIFIITFFIAYGILFYHLVKERNKRYSLMKEYQKLKCEYDSQSKDSYMYFSNAEKERNAKHELMAIISLLTEEGFTFAGEINTLIPPKDAGKETIYYSREYERYFIIYDKDNVHEVKVTDCFDYPK